MGVQNSCTLITRYITSYPINFFSDKNLIKKKIIKINHGILETRSSTLRMFRKHQPLPLHLLLSMLRHRCNRRKNRLRERLFHGRLQNLYPSLQHLVLEKTKRGGSGYGGNRTIGGLEGVGYRLLFGSLF